MARRKRNRRPLRRLTRKIKRQRRKLNPTRRSLRPYQKYDNVRRYRNTIRVHKKPINKQSVNKMAVSEYLKAHKITKVFNECVRRSKRKEVLHALRRTGKGSGGRGKLRITSYIKC